MHRTQSTISLRIRTLEERLGTHLFLRDSRRLALSRDGENFLIHARRIIQVQNEAIAALKRTGSHGVIRFGLPEDYAELWLPDLLGKFYRLRPDARPHIDCRMSLELIERLQAGELDRHSSSGTTRKAAVVISAARTWCGPRIAISCCRVARRCRSRCFPKPAATVSAAAALAALGRPYHVVYTSQARPASRSPSITVRR